MKVGMISLGCSKNQVDSEMILGLLLRQGFTITTSLEDADLVVINTCAFIDSAKNEAIENIASVVRDKKENQKIIVCGCFAERYREWLEYNFKDIDLVITLKDYPHFAEKIAALFGTKEDHLTFNNRVLISSSFAPYIRIADGCNNHCAFCAIPLIRGKYISRTMEDIQDEVNYLVKNGAKEINLVAQDTSKYGVDNYHKLMLPELLKRISAIDGVYLIRIFYIYPETVTDELIKVIKEHQNIAPYFDIPFQHASNHILKAMNRRTSEEEAYLLINKIRKEIPDAVIRTTLMVGFPGETHNDFKELLKFVETAKFFHMGAFAYSREEDTSAFTMKRQVPHFVAKMRYDALMKKQESIALELKKQLIGQIYTAIVEDYDDESYTYSLRSYQFAPDEVDGGIIATCPFENNIKLGDIVKVKILDATAYDLYGEITEAEEKS